MYVKIHTSGYDKGSGAVIAVCDEDLIGKTLKTEKIELKVSEQFYKGDTKTEDEVITILKEARNINLLGKKAVAAGIKAGIIEKEKVLLIQGVPHAQAFAV